MHRLAALATLIPIVACSGPAAPPTLADELAPYAETVANSVMQLQDALGRRYDALPQLYAQITDMRMGVNVAIALDTAARVPTEETDQAALDRYLDYGAELLSAMADLDAAIAVQDVGAASLAAARIDIAAGEAALDLPPALCVLAVPPSSRDFCDRVEPIGEYEQSLERVFLEFVANYRPFLRLPEAFGDVVRGGVLTEAAPSISNLFADTASRLDALAPDQPHAAVHEALSSFIANTRMRWERVDPEQADLLIGQLLIADLRDITCSSDQEVGAARALLLGAVPDSAVPRITSIFFDDPDAGCVDL